MELNSEVINEPIDSSYWDMRSNDELGLQHGQDPGPELCGLSTGNAGTTGTGGNSLDRRWPTNAVVEGQSSSQHPAETA